MAPVQQTFQVIPNGAGGAPRGDQPLDRPPMTTKQAKKAYKAKNKGPKLSKADQRRQDLLEQDRIRRELEKERNQARTRTARDKRREKEDREKAEKRRKGLPLVEVHPSQDTISRFIRRAPTVAAAVDNESPKNLMLGEGQEPEAGPHVGIKEDQDTNNHEEEDSTAVDLPPVMPPGQEEVEDDRNKAPPSCREDSNRPAKRQRIHVPLETTPAPDRIPDGMFKRPKSCGLLLAETLPPRVPENNVVVDPLCVDARNPAVGEDPTNQQKHSESFSTDDGFFDEIDLYAIEAKLGDAFLLESARPLEGRRPSAESPCDLRQPVRTDLDTSCQLAREKPQASKTHKVLPKSDAIGRETSPQSARASENVLGINILAEPSTRGSLSASKSTAHTARRVNPIPAHKQAHIIQPDTMISPIAGNMQRPGLPLEPGKTAKDSRYAEQPPNQAPNRVSALPLQKRLGNKSPSFAVTANSAPKPPNVPGNRGRQALEELSLNQNQNNGPNSRSGMESPAMKSKNQPQAEGAKTPLFRKPQGPLARPDVFRSPKTPMGPPPIPPKFRSADHQHPLHESRGPIFLPSKRSDPNTNNGSTNLTAHGSPLKSNPPSSTQAFLLSHVDDLFPSPSQEVQELFERPKEATARGSSRPKRALLRRPDMPPPMNNVSGQPLRPPRAVSAKSAHNTPQMAKSPAAVSSVRAIPDKKSSHIESKTPRNPSIDFMSFISTQDVMLSSQDLQELEEDSPAPKDCTSATMGQSERPPSHMGPELIKSPTFDQTCSPIGGRSINETPYGQNLPTNLEVMNTVDRVLEPGFHSQQSSGLPDIPSVSRSRVAVVPPIKGRILGSFKQTELPKNSSNSAADMLGDDISEFLGEDEDISIQGERVKSITDGAPPSMEASTPSAHHSSPKRFFTSSGTKEKVYLAMERLKPNAWVDDNTRLKHQEELDLLFKKAEEKAAMEGIERMFEKEGEGQTAQPYSQGQVIPSSDPRSREPRSSGQRRSQSQKSKGGSQRSCRAQPQSSYEKMLELANGPAKGEDIIPASQESDYSDVPWDDDLMKLCS